MKFTNKKLETEFFEWYIMKYFADRCIVFRNLPQSAQFGLFQEFCDMKGIYVYATREEELDGKKDYYWCTEYQDDWADSLSEAQIQAFNKVNEIWE